MNKLQVLFARNVKNVVDIFNEWGNPFTETNSDFLAVDTSLVMADEVVQSIKEAENGTGNHLRVSERTHIPQNWKSILHVDSNKTELFKFPASVIESAVTPEGKIFVTTKGETVVSASPIDMSAIQPCTQEEVDHRMILHCAHAYKHGI